MELKRRTFLRSTLQAILAVLVILTGASASCQTFTNPVRVPTAVDPSSITYGDLNGDGRIDLIWISVTATGATAQVELAQNGGSYQAGSTFTIPTTSNNIPQCVTADVTRDGKLDVICAGLSTATAIATVFVFAGNGDGTFAAPVASQYGSQYSQAVTFALIGDVNNDGVPDFLLVDDFYSLALVLLSDGKGGFLPAKSAPTSYNYSAPFVADINGDGIPDLLWPEGAGVTLGKGDGSFGTLLAPYAPPHGPINCAFHDMDGDGKLDAVCAYLSSNVAGTALDILHGNGDGTFNPTAIFHQTFGSASIANSGTGEILVPEVITDVNGDGIPDILAFGGDGLTVLLGQPGLTFAAPSEYALAYVGYSESWPATGQRAYVDLNGDGLLDVLAAGPNGIYLLYGHSDGSFGTAKATTVSEVNGHIAVADFNGDGKPDLVSSGAPQTSVLLGHGDGTFASPVPVSGAPFAAGATLYVADFNGDGKADLLSSDGSSNHYLMPGRGDGTFGAAIATSGLPTALTSASLTDTYSTPYALTGDLNGDGKADVFSIQTSSLSPTYSLVSALSAGDGSFRTVSTSYAAPVYLANTFYDTPVAEVLGDFAHSGKLDAAYYVGGNIDVVRGNGDGSFSPTPTLLSIPTVAGTQPNTIQAMQVGDLDGDGNLDLVFLSWFAPGAYFYQSGPSCVFIYYGKGDGTFASPTQAGCFTHAYTDFRIADVNGDGRPDLVLQTASALNDYVVGVIDNLGGRAFGPEINFTAGSLSGDLFVADLNLDGRPDLVFGNQRYEAGYSADSVTVLLNTTSAVSTSLPTTTTLTCSPNPVSAFGTASFSASAYAGGVSVSGGFTFTDNGAALYQVAGPVGVATYADNSPAVGTHQIVATFVPPGSYAASSASCTEVVNALATTTALTVTPAGSVYGTPVVLSAAVAPVTPVAGHVPTGTVSFYYQAANSGLAALLGKVAVNGAGVAALSLPTLPGGTGVLSCRYSGDANFAPSNCVTMTDTVAAAATTLTLTSSLNPAPALTAVTFTSHLALAGGGVPPVGTALSLSLNSQAIVLATDASGSATYTTSGLVAGTYPVAAGFAGTANLLASSAALTEVVTVPPSGFGIALLPNSVTIVAGQTKTVGIQLTSLGAFAGPLALTAGTLPQYVTGSIAPTPVTLTAGGTGASVLTLNTMQRAEGVVPLRPGSRWPAVVAAGCLVLLPLGRRRRWLKGFLGMVCLGVLLQTVAACNIVLPG